MILQKDSLKLFSNSIGFLIVVCVILAAFISFKIFISKDQRNVDELVITSSKIKPKDFEKVDIPENKPFETYNETFRQRDLFAEKPPSNGSDNGGQDTPQGFSATLGVNWKKDFQLVGIVIDQDPQVIILDLNNDETLFLSQGDKIGEAVLQDIEEGKAVFLYEGRTIELFP